MSILIPDMKMPKDNPVTINIYRDGSWVNAYTKENGEAIEVPPHRRLIDADELIERYTPDMNRQIYGGNFIFDIEHMPTIIPAEPCKEKGE